MSHKKKAHSGMKNDKQPKMGMMEPMAKGAGNEHHKSMKKGHKAVRGK